MKLVNDSLNIRIQNATLFFDKYANQELKYEDWKISYNNIFSVVETRTYLRLHRELVACQISQLKLLK